MLPNVRAAVTELVPPLGQGRLLRASQMLERPSASHMRRVRHLPGAACAAAPHPRHGQGLRRDAPEIGSQSDDPTAIPIRKHRSPEPRRLVKPTGSATRDLHRLPHCGCARFLEARSRRRKTKPSKHV